MRITHFIESDLVGRWVWFVLAKPNPWRMVPKGRDFPVENGKNETGQRTILVARQFQNDGQCDQRNHL